MKILLSTCLVMASLSLALTRQCTGDPFHEGGNWFCGAVNHILYEGLIGKGTFQVVTQMGNDGQCHMEEKAYSGPLAPLDEDLSIHVRGPIQFKEVAVYNLAPTRNVKRASKSSPALGSHMFHGHRHFHKEGKEEWPLSRNGEKASSAANASAAFSGLSTSTSENAAASSSSSQPAKATLQLLPEQESKNGSHIKAPLPHKPFPPEGGDWDRIAYYNAEKQAANNIIFMGNYGGQGSGVWDSLWGNSLSFLDANGIGGANSPQILKDVYIPSNKEFAIFSAEKCDEGCGFTRDEQTAYKGFAGANKVFLFHFKMPLDGDRGFNGDMSALWNLNGRIPRTAQYHSCSCWKSGCGEVDIFEVLSNGDTKCKSTFHIANGAGSSDYFRRPVDKFIKVAIVFDEKTASVSIRVLPDETEFSDRLDAKTVQGWMTRGNGSPTSSLFQISQR